MNTSQFAFIICANSEQYYNECVRYIQDIYIPENFSVDIICIQEADSMAQGYNAGMRSSDALYKVYLHQDTFILNRNFLYDILKVFESDENIGMIGVLGVRELPQDADCYLKWDTGAVTAHNGKTVLDLNLYQNKDKKYIPVKAIDGLIMVTQRDIPWREDFLDGWDFYDVSQSLEMDRHGYMVVVPYQEKLWCYHDCGASKIEKYHFYRHKMIRKYPQYFKGDDFKEDADASQQRHVQNAGICSGMIKLVSAGAYDELVSISNSIQEALLQDTDIRELVNLMKIYSLEKESDSGHFSEWWIFRDWEQIREYYRWLRFVLLRIGYQREDERIEELKVLMKEGRISRDAVSNITITTLGSLRNVYNCLLREV